MWHIGLSANAQYSPAVTPFVMQGNTMLWEDAHGDGHDKKAFGANASHVHFNICGQVDDVAPHLHQALPAATGEISFVNGEAVIGTAPG